MFLGWLWPGLECKEVGPFRVPLTAFLFAGAPGAEVERPGWKETGEQVEAACSNWWTCPYRTKIHAPSPVRDGCKVKTQIKGQSFLQWAPDSARSGFSIFSTLILWLMWTRDADIFWAEVDVKWILVIPPTTPIRVSWTASLGLPSCNFHL